MEHIIKYYPVGNADCTLIKLDNGKTIIVDCQMLADLTDGHGKQVMFDVKADLLKELKKDGLGRPFVDLFISTHWAAHSPLFLSLPLLWIFLLARTLTTIIAKDLLGTFTTVKWMITTRTKIRMRLS